MPPLRKAYLAGPEVFLRNAVAIGAEKKRICAAHGIEGLFPLDMPIPEKAVGPARAAAIYRACLDLLDTADLVIANMTPFRGPGMDGGTAFEMGYAAHLGIPVFGYSNCSADLLARVRRAGPVRTTIVGGTACHEDEAGLSVEDFGLADNLMMVGAVHAGGVPVILGDCPPDRLYTDLTAFEACVRLAAG